MLFYYVWASLRIGATLLAIAPFEFGGPGGIRTRTAEDLSTPAISKGERIDRHSPDNTGTWQVPRVS